jgi:hypothetical protein
MTYTYIPTNNIGRMRRTIPDRVEADAIWTDEELQSFLDDCANNWRRATALALETMASDNLLVLKVIRIQNIETNTDRLMSALLARAKRLREDASDEDSLDDGAFDVAEIIVNDHQYRERIYGQALRGNI